MLNSRENLKIKDNFLKEVTISKEVQGTKGHPNILPIIGYCITDEPLYLVMPFMKYGDLLGFIRKCRLEEVSEIITMFTTWGKFSRLGWGVFSKVGRVDECVVGASLQRWTSFQKWGEFVVGRLLKLGRDVFGGRVVRIPVRAMRCGIL